MFVSDAVVGDPSIGVGLEVAFPVGAEKKGAAVVGEEVIGPGAGAGISTGLLVSVTGLSVAVAGEVVPTAGLVVGLPVVFDGAKVSQTPANSQIPS